MLTVYRKRAAGALPTVADPTDSLGTGDRQFGAGDHRDVPRVNTMKRGRLTGGRDTTGLDGRVPVPREPNP
jgi:hypothetical protein